MADDEPGFTIRVVTAGTVVELHASAAMARRNVVESSQQPRTGLPRVMTVDDLRDRSALHEALATVAADVLLGGDQQIRVMQDKRGHWWSFRREMVGAVEVLDDEPDTPVHPPIGFRFPGT